MADIIDLDLTRDPLPVKKRKRARGPTYCFHQFEVDDEGRTVFCTKCERGFDAFDALLYVAQRWDRIRDGVRFYEDERKRLEAKVIELQRQERNAKARLKRAQRKLEGID